MSHEQRTVLAWLKSHHVPKKFRRYIGIAWTHISKIAGRVGNLTHTRVRFITALIIGAIAALILAQCPLVANLLPALGLSFAVVIGLVEELKAAIRN